jgi:hypothetical protein
LGGQGYKDDLVTEIRKKIAVGYPTTNTLFEDTRRAVLYQNNKPVLEVDLTRPKELTTILDSFFHWHISAYQYGSNPFGFTHRFYRTLLVHRG